MEYCGVREALLMLEPNEQMADCMGRNTAEGGNCLTDHDLELEEMGVDLENEDEGRE